MSIALEKQELSRNLSYKTRLGINECWLSVMNSKNVFASNFRRILLERGLTAADIARMIGVDKSTVTHWVKERSTPSDTQKDKICDALNLHISAFYAPLETPKTTLEEALRVVNEHMPDLVLRRKKVK